MENNVTTTSPDLLEDIQVEQQYEDANNWLRLANYLIDLILFYLVFIFGIGTIIVATQSEALIDGINNLPVLVDRLIGMVSYALFMSLIEGFSKGRSLGKLITGTKVVRWDNQSFGWGDAFGRSFSRIVPFEFLSIFWGSPWHDKWTDTRVVKANS